MVSKREAERQGRGKRALQSSLLDREIRIECRLVLFFLRFHCNYRVRDCEYTTHEGIETRRRFGAFDHFRLRLHARDFSNFSINSR